MMLSLGLTREAFLWKRAAREVRRDQPISGSRETADGTALRGGSGIVASPSVSFSDWCRPMHTRADGGIISCRRLSRSVRELGEDVAL